MIDALKFVRGAVAKKDFQPALTHFLIAHGRVLGYNGTVALSSPIDLDVRAMPKALPFVKAIERCTAETTVVHMTPAGKIGLQSGAFRAYIDCHSDSEILDAIVPEGQEVQLSGFLKALNVLEPYVATDASRAWAMGILLRGRSAFATNNIIFAEYWVGENLPEVNIPSSAIDELLRIGEEPIRVIIGERSMTFFYTGDRWMRTQLLDTDWPDITPILNGINNDNLVPLTDALYDAVELLAPFVDIEGRVYFRPGEVCTSPLPGEGASVASVGMDITEQGAYHHKHLLSLKGRATHIDFTPHPKPCPFQGPLLRGVILGMRDD
jgi:hypothetical protein